MSKIVFIEHRYVLIDKNTVEITYRNLYNLGEEENRRKTFVKASTPELFAALKCNSDRFDHAKSMALLRNEKNPVNSITRDLMEPLAEVKELLIQLNIAAQA